MRKMIFDVPAESGGALTILNQYYDRAVKDEENDYIFIVSVVDLKETENVKVLKYPWVKKSWFHRLFFDKFISNRIVKKYSPNEVLSLQNVCIKGISSKQILYVHQALPFSDKKYSFFENKKYWVYQNIIGRMIKKSICQVDVVIVQTNWMKKKIRDISKKVEILVESPGINPDFFLNSNIKINRKLDSFFYPASADIYKNHLMIMNVIKKIKYKELNCQFSFTIDTDVSDKRLKKALEDINTLDLPIQLLGAIPREEVFERYYNSVLLFASDIESFGLPLLEAKKCGTPIIVKDKEFSREILNNYNKVYYFKNEEELEKLIIQFCMDEINN